MALILLHDAVSLCTALFQGTVPRNIFKGKPLFDVRQSHPALFKSWCTRCLCNLNPSICKYPFWPKEIDMSFACRKTMQIRLFFQRIHLKSKVNWETVEGNLGLQNVAALYSTLTVKRLCKHTASPWMWLLVFFVLICWYCYSKIT